ncbi:MAG: sulfite exporter TauE/SafE family protein [Rhizobiaceae bacterium]|nr:sulfite exporter TauE/SafE family protein [Rhizobiaceae bacterium]MCV0407322.1 sulfite exporter TauE/SafE family protein [Rhizobiaceae bacterium]
MDLPTDPLFYLTAVPAVILVGLSKGGLGGAMALIGVPLMSLAMPPLQAAAVLLPILIVMDLVSLWTWRGRRDRTTLINLLPAAMAGIALGWLTASLVTADGVRLMVGLVAMAFFFMWVWRRFSSGDGARPHGRFKGAFWGLISGFTSFVAHAGGPPYQVYALPLRQDPKLYTGTSVVFFAIVNAVKLVPYLALGQFDATNLGASAVLMPIAPLAILSGAWIVRRIRPDHFYTLMYGMMFVVGLKLVWDGIASLA